MMGGKGKGSGGIGIGNGIGSGSVGAVDAPKPAQPLPPQRDVPEWAGFGARMQRVSHLVISLSDNIAVEPV